MTKDELKEIAQTVAIIMQQSQSVKTEKTDGVKITDMIFKGFSTISLALVSWILSTVSDMKQQNATYQVKQENLIENVSEIKDKVESFTSKPRFTADDFTSKIIPLTNQVNLNTAELNQRNGFMQETNAKIQELQLDINLLKQTKK